MKRYVLLAGVALFAVALLLVASCGKKTEDKAEGEAGQGSSFLKTISKTAMQDADLETEAPAYKQRVEAAGYTITDYVKFPAQEVGVKGRVLIYEDKTGKRGGLVFFKKTGNIEAVKPAWHWYFDDLAPTTITNLELNEDGLWDARIETKQGETLELIQDEMFTLMGAERSGWLAMNGRCSPPADINSMMWKAFDGDTTTSWRSALGASGENAYIEVDTPFGVEEGVLAMWTLADAQPAKCKVFADGKEVQAFELKPVAAEQMIHIGAGLLAARSIRVEFESVHGSGDVVAVAEMEIK